LPRRTGLAPALFTLFRTIPVLSWTGGALAVGVAAAAAAAGWRTSYLIDVPLMAAGAALFQGLVTHAVNDLEDWRSGTDPLSPGLLSGGSRVIPRSLLSEREVWWVAVLALMAALALSALLYLRHGPVVLAVAATGVWVAVSYTLPPLRLSYRPFVGELLAGWPAVFAIIIGAFVILAGPPNPAVWAAAAIQATLSIAWVMQHHLPDVTSDLRASPTKVTTPAYFSRRWGLPAGRAVPAGYHLTAAVLSVVAGLSLHPAFLGSALLAGLGAREALATDVSSVPDITRRELRMIALTGANALFLALAFLFGGLTGS